MNSLNSNSNSNSSNTPTVASTSKAPSAITVTNVYLVLWCIHLLQPLADLILFGKGSGGLDSRPIVPWDYQCLVPALLATLMSLLMYQPPNAYIPPLYLALFCHLVDLIVRFHRLPAVWDHEIWGCLVNLSFLLCYTPVIFSSSHNPPTVPRLSLSMPIERAEASFLTLARIQLGFLYGAATFWKINTSFLNPTTSCGTILILELFGTYFPSSWVQALTSKDYSYLLEMLVQTAPYKTLGVEAILALGTVSAVHIQEKNKATINRDATVLLATVFHLMIFMMPVNSAGGFSLECMTRLVLLFDSDELQQWYQLLVLQPMRESQLSLAKHPTTKISLLTGLTIGLFMLWRHSATGAPFDVGFALAGALLAWHTVLVVASRRFGVTGRDATKTVHSMTWTYGAIFTISILITTLWAFVAPILGIMQMSAPTMYANLRMYQNGGNHLLVPTAILGKDILFGGGLIQVVSSTSWTLNLRLAHIPSSAVFPSPVNTLLNPIIRSNTTGVYQGLPLQLFPMCMYNPHSREVLLDDYVPFNPTDASVSFTSFIIPISTIREMLEEASDRNESFVLELSENLDSKPSNITRLESDAISGTLSCQEFVNGIMQGPCSTKNPGIFQLLTNPIRLEDHPWSYHFWKPIVDKLLVPYPELVGMDEEICMS